MQAGADMLKFLTDPLLKNWANKDLDSSIDALQQEIRDLVSNGASTDQLRQAMRATGTRGLREAGLAALTAGITTIDEVVRETVLEDEG